MSLMLVFANQVVRFSLAAAYLWRWIFPLAKGEDYEMARSKTWY
jgi:hypothetical protein